MVVNYFAFLVPLFRIVAVQLSDNGTYMCMAKNQLGSLFIETELIVQGFYYIHLFVYTTKAL
jgi:hypothetical protein